MRRISVALAALLLLGTARSSQPETAAASEEEVSELAAALPSADEAERLFLSFARLLGRRGGAAGNAEATKRLFDRFNRFTDARVTASGGAEQQLGPQEVRALLKEVGLGNVLVRGELAGAAIRALDSDGDGRVSLAELRTALDVALCWIGEEEEGAADDAALLAPSRRLGALAEKVGDAASAGAADDGMDALMEEVHRCGGPLAAWWAAWEARVDAVQSRFEAAADARDALASEESVEQCSSALVGAVVGKRKGGKKKEEEGGAAGATAIRRALKEKMKVEPLLAR